MILLSRFSFFIMLKWFAYKPDPNTTTNSCLRGNCAYVKLITRKITAQWVNMIHQYFRIRFSQNISPIPRYLYRFIKEANIHDLTKLKSYVKIFYRTALIVGIFSFPVPNMKTETNSEKNTGCFKFCGPWFVRKQEIIVIFQRICNLTTHESYCLTLKNVRLYE